MRQVTETDPDGIEVTHHRTVDTLGLMLTSGAITSAMHDAARDFQASFTIACFDSMPSINLTSFVQSTSSAQCRPRSDDTAGRRARTRRTRTRCARRPRLAGRIMRLACCRHADRPSANGLCARAGADDRFGRRVLRASWSLRSVCSQSTTDSVILAYDDVRERMHLRVTSMGYKQNAFAICFLIDGRTMQVLAFKHDDELRETNNNKQTTPMIAGPPWGYNLCGGQWPGISLPTAAKSELPVTGQWREPCA